MTMRAIVMAAVAGVVLLGGSAVRAGHEPGAGEQKVVKPEQKLTPEQEGKLKEKLDALHAAIEEFHKAVEAKDSVAAKTAFEKIKELWGGLPPVARGRIEKERPELMAKLREIKQRMEAHKDAQTNGQTTKPALTEEQKAKYREMMEKRKAQLAEGRK